MRFVSLALERYGHFTDRTLAFDREAVLTVVHGGNEAGKTTALAAIADALYGFEERSRFNFLHDYKAMRVSAELLGRRGETLAFRRLKRRAAALVDPLSEAALAEDCLVPFLGAHDRRAFLDIFGLDQARLREGGRKLLAGGGDLAEALVAAAPGLAPIAMLRDRLRDSAGQIFDPKRRVASHALYRALDRRDAARAAIRAGELRVETVRAARDARDAAAAARREAEAAEREARLALRRAETHALAFEDVGRIDRHAAGRAALGGLPALSAGFAPRARAALGAHETAAAAAARAAEEAARAEAETAAITVDAAVLARAEAIDRADETRAAVANEIEALPRRRAEADAARGTLAHIAGRLGLADVAALRAALPGAALLSRAAGLIDRLREQAVRREALAAERRTLAEAQAALEEERVRLGHAADPSEMRGRLDALDGAEERDRALRRQTARAAAEEQDLAERTRRLGWGLADADALAVLPLPDVAAAEAALALCRTARETRDRAVRTLAESEDALRLAAARIAAATAAGAVPTPAAIEAARTLRDALWQGLRAPATGGRAALPDDIDAAARLDAALAAADRLADERLTEAHRVAELAQLERARAEAEARRATAEAQVAEAGAAVTDAEAGWAALWREVHGIAAAGIAAGAEERLLAALREARTVLEERSRLRRERADQKAADDLCRAERAAVETLRTQLGLVPAGDGPLAMKDVREAVERRDARFRAASEVARDLARGAAEAAALRRREAELDAAAQALGAECAEVFPQVAVRPQAAADEARAALDLWREAPAAVEALRTAEHRIARIEEDRDRFAAEVAALAALLDLPPPDDPAAAIRRLKVRLDEARRAGARAEQAVEAAARRTRARAAADEAAARAAAGLAPLVAEAGLAAIADLPPLLARLDAAEAHDRAVAEARARLALHIPAFDEAALRADLAGRDEAALLAARLAAEGDVARAAAAHAAAIERHIAADHALAALDETAGAAAAAQDERDALAEITDAATRFVRDHTAARLLSSAIDLYRARHQSPLIERVSAAFATLTGGAWSGIGIDYDQDPPRLAALRDGRHHAVDALSEGTADQLFLALRVAAIEDHAGRAAPLPFVGDDLFVSFDERRTRAGLALLAELGRHTQVLLFTHHEHVVEAAEAVLGGRVQAIRLAGAAPDGAIGTAP
ncbi:AAA family ATPase [Prosthecomicrobium pneumaticum]|uniref:Uncharacterized protein YhaN n=1 Tax=Prosthecomicrobium pneumaticum TaxID=81895 RepID=A0A7W9FME2_9HYPH|nr:AAA family ATPase [Prosthecomicrobium pneumaticum]MBB5753355.1 uncharacterized protein YhaN [Prosthecomicrobium pneumaticum]